MRELTLSWTCLFVCLFNRSPAAADHTWDRIKQDASVDEPVAVGENWQTGKFQFNSIRPVSYQRVVKAGASGQVV